MPHWYEDKKPYRDYDEDGRDGRATRDARATSSYRARRQGYHTGNESTADLKALLNSHWLLILSFSHILSTSSVHRVRRGAFLRRYDSGPAHLHPA